MFARAGAAGLSVVRTWVHTNDPKFPFQTGPGVYNEQAFQALDFVIAEARRSGIKLLLSLVDNWKYYNGVDQYVDWSTTAEPRTQARPSHDWGDPDPKRGQDAAQELYELRRHALFFNDTSCRNLYKNHVYAVVNRRNTFTGRLYKDDPTIMAWELLNEPRCETWSVPQCEAILQNWIEVMSAYVKEVDPNHLVTIGSEGFFGSSSSLAHMNPKSWAGDMGQDFVSNNAVKGIDFSTIHVWPDHWDRHDDEFQAKWILGLADISARVLHKPMVVEEFGKKLPIDGRHLDNILRLRDPVFQETYSAIEKSLVNGLATGGSIFWRWDLPMFEGAGRGEYGVAPEDSTFDLVTQHATFVNRWTTSQPPERHCKCECWIPHSDVFTRTCKNLPKVCDAYWEVMAGANELNYTAALNALQRTEVQLGHRLIALRGLQVYGTKSDCCHPGLGAFPKGCTWYPSFSA
ncbi:unnamed protein product [Ostreobium quekettii]|uniref:mannan endo-1,4-beta-mannosidase n=1 Tax=Ostreobium quekettii TaxID=121088 RepID=A0A8S1J8A9_9CHLO|nr:unnamed protein product [Ostreobium quekettii]